MSEFDPLKAWIHADHLSSAGIAQHQANFKEHSAALLHLKDCGSLNIVEQSDASHKVEAATNSFALFDVKRHKQHYVAPVAESAGKLARLTIGGWFRDRNS